MISPQFVDLVCASGQAAEVERVKRAEGFMVENPHTVSAQASVQEARLMLAEHNIGGLLVSGPGGDGTVYPWRFWLDGEPTVSSYRPGARRQRPIRSAGA